MAHARADDALARLLNLPPQANHQGTWSEQVEREEANQNLLDVQPRNPYPHSKR